MPRAVQGFGIANDVCLRSIGWETMALGKLLISVWSGSGVGMKHQRLGVGTEAWI